MRGARVFLFCALVLTAEKAEAHVSRPDTKEQEPLQFAEEEEIRTFFSSGGAFKLHFTLEGPNATSGEDDDASGVPDYVEQVAQTYDEALAYFQDSLGFLPPVSDVLLAQNGGNGRFDIYLIDVRPTPGGFLEEDCPASADPLEPVRCTGFIVHPSLQAHLPASLSSYVAYHFFLAIEAAYHARRSPYLERSSALWAAHAFDPAGQGMTEAARRYQAAPGRGLFNEDREDFESLAFFLLFIDEVHGRESLRAFWEALADPAVEAWPTALVRVVGLPMSEIFTAFCEWSLTSALAPVSIEPLGEVLRMPPMSARFFEVTSRGDLIEADVSQRGASALLILVASRRLQERPVQVQSDGSRMIFGLINTSSIASSGPLRFCAGSASEVAECFEPSSKKGCACAGRPKGPTGGLLIWLVLGALVAAAHKDTQDVPE